MIYLSILAKTFALALVQPYPWLAGGCWAGGALVDLRINKMPGGTLFKLLGRVAWLNLAALVLGWAALVACDYAAMRWKEGIPLLASLVGGLLTLTGQSAGSHGGLVYLTTMAGPLEFAASIDHLALKVPWLFFVLSGVWLLWASATLQDALRRLGLITGILLAVVVVRMVCQVLLATSLFDFIGYESEELPFRLFMNTTALGLLYLPFLLAVAALIGRWLPPPCPLAAAGAPDAADAPPDAAPAAGLPRILRWAVAPLLLGLAILACWEPRGTPKDGKLVISSYHAQWSRCDRPYDREWYGADSGYNYACMKRFFGVFYPVVEATGPLVAKDLEGAANLVIYDPDRQFSKEEITLVQEFVRNGGGLFVIGDHTNVFGSTTHLNELCEPFGFQYRDDVLFDLDTDFHQMLDVPQWPARAWHGMSMFKLRGPTSLRPTSAWTRSIYQVGHSKGVRAIYSVNNFYPPPHDDPKMVMGTFCVGTASHYGRGRVVAWADSTVFSTFELFYPGKYEHLLNTVDWLNHKNSAVGGVMRRVVTIFVLAGLALFLALRRNPRVWLATAVLAVTCLGVARLASAWLEERQTTFPKPLQPSEWVVFAAHAKDKGHHLQDFITEEPYDQRYEVFIQWVMRTGAYAGFQLLDKPRGNGLYAHLRASDKTTTAMAMIVRKPGDLAQLDEVGALAMRPKDPLLLLFASTIPAAQAVASIQHAGLVKTPEALARIAEAWPAGEVLLRDGERPVMVVAGAERFSDQAMGISEKVVPDATQLTLFNKVFGVIDRVLGRGPGAEK